MPSGARGTTPSGARGTTPSGARGTTPSGARGTTPSGARGTTIGRPLEHLDAQALRRWLRRSVEALEIACPRIDALNVFPVPDGDTGSNLLATMRSAAAAAERVATGVLDAAAGGALTGARGSSGVILARYLRGMADGAVGRDQVDGCALQAALSAASDAAYAAVSEPVEGTVLSVARAAAQAARCADDTTAGLVTTAAAAAAAVELALTTRQLAALEAAGVVDAGGQGLVVVLDALADVTVGVTSPVQPRLVDVSSEQRPAAISSPAFAYEVQYLLAAPTEALSTLRERLAALGDSVAVVSGHDLHNVHVHVDDVGAAIEAALDLGRPSRIAVTRFADQMSSCSPVTALPAVVAVLCTDSALAALFDSLGAVSVLVRAGDGAAEIGIGLESAIDQAASAIVLPNSRALKDLADEAVAALRAAGRAVTVVPTRSPLQGLAALAVHDAVRSTADDVVAMSAAAASTRYAEVTVATYDAQTTAGPCHAGDVLGLIDDDVAIVGADVATVARGLLDRLLIGGGEIVTVVAGAGLPPKLSDDLVAYVTATRPAVDVVAWSGGQRTPCLLLGVE